MRSWKDVTPAEAAVMPPEELALIDRPTNEAGEVCPWPWDPQQLAGAPLGQYHCPYCGGMVMAGVPHFDDRDFSCPAHRVELVERGGALACPELGCGWRKEARCPHEGADLR